MRLVRQHGWNATSFQVLQPGFHYFFGPVPDDGCVAYVDTGRAWVAAGPPLCATAHFAPLTDAFIRAGRTAGRRSCFFGTERRFAGAVALQELLVGQQPVWQAARWPETLAATPSLREQLRRARAKGVRVRATSAAELQPTSPVGAQVAALLRRWLDARELPPMGFLVNVDPLVVRDDHRLFVAEAPTAGAAADARPHVVGLLAAAPIFARRGWMLQVLMRAPDAPNGTAESLVDQAMRVAAADDGGAVVTLGLAPLIGPVHRGLRWARRAGLALFDFEGLHAFKAKLRPSAWDPIYLSFPPGQSSLKTVLDVLAAFAHGHLLRFGLKTLLRGPAIVVRLLALALLPWTVGLWAVDTQRWFPAPAVKAAWIVFDVLLAGGLLSLTRRWRGWLADALLAAVGGDAVLTVLEAGLWNARRVRSGWDVAVLVAAALAPALAFFLLWQARTRRQ